MFEHFSDSARKAMALANLEAQRLNHEFVGTEHLLLGLLEESTGVAAVVLRRLGMDLKQCRAQANILRPGSQPVAPGKLPQSPSGKKAIEFTIEEARLLHETEIKTQHLLLGLLRVQEGRAIEILSHFNLTPQQVRDEVLKTLAARTPRPAVMPVAVSPDDQALAELAALWPRLPRDARAALVTLARSAAGK